MFCVFYYASLIHLAGILLTLYGITVVEYCEKIKYPLKLNIAFNIQYQVNNSTKIGWNQVEIIPVLLDDANMRKKIL